MINNNRQNGRRRGRGGGPRTPQSSNAGNYRQDNRSRGNAVQLHEKYKSMARDAQMQGDRVQSEYYLQFAEHYFRVLNESRSRFEEQRPRRDDYAEGEDEGEEGGAYAEGGDYDRDERPQREERPREERFAREDRPQRDDRPQREERVSRDDRPSREDRPQGEERLQREERPARAERGEYRQERNGEGRPPRGRVQPRRNTESEGEENDERISLEVLPPAIVADNDVAKPVRRRTRRPREEDDIAPAA